ncbi:MAG: hypothetical protein ABII68_01800 [Pseudomonadota bacterium]
MQKNIKENIQTLFREIEIYRSHGLFVEAREKCDFLAKLIQGTDRIKNKQELLNVVAMKVNALKDDARKTEEVSEKARMTAKQQELVRDLFAFEKDKDPDSIAMEGATALLMFGQFERALSEFSKLLKNDALRVAAAKSIIRCHIGLSSLDDAVRHYNKWFSSGRFPRDGLGKIRSLLNSALKEKGIDATLPKSEEMPEVGEDDARAEEFIDISSLEITVDDTSKKGKRIMLDVRYQKGNLVSVIIPRSDKALLDRLKVGLKLNDVQFYSPAVVFMDSCVVSAKKQIKTGPKKEDYAVVMKILNI